MSREMRDSGIPWIGEIPNHWKVERIKTIFSERVELSENGTESLLSVSEYYGVDKRREHVEEGEYVSRSENLVGYKKCFKGDFVSNIMLAWKGSFGVSDYDGVVSPAYCVYKPSITIYPKYYHYLFRTSLYTGRFKCFSKGIIDSRLRLYSPYFYDIEAIIPSIEEQQAIADFLDIKCSEIDELISLQEKFIEELKSYKQSVITEAVTKGLNPDVPMKDSGIEWIGEIPDSWSIVRFKGIANIVRGGSPRPIEEYISDEGYNWIKIGDTIKGNKYIHFVKQKIRKEGLSKTRLVHKGDLILTNSMSFGEPYILKVDGCIHDGWVAFSDISHANKEFLYYYLCSSFCKMHFDIQVAGGVVQNLNVDKIASTLISLPPIEEQQAIAIFLDEKCSEIDSLISLKQSKIEQLKEYKKSIIYEYVTGKKEVNG